MGRPRNEEGASFPMDEYMKEVYRIRKIREDKGIVVNPMRMMKIWPKTPYTDDERVRYEREPSENEKKMDAAFKAYYDSGCKLKLKDVMEIAGVAETTVSAEFSKAGISFMNNAGTR